MVDGIGHRGIHPDNAGVASCSAADYPQILPLISWLYAVMVLIAVPTAKAETTR